MPLPTAIVWLPPAVGLTTPAVVYLIIWLRSEIAKRRGSDESDGSDGGGGGGSRRPPPPPPAGPVSWPEFERQFPDYVRARSSASKGAGSRSSRATGAVVRAPVRGRARSASAPVRSVVCARLPRAAADGDAGDRVKRQEV